MPSFILYQILAKDLSWAKYHSRLRGDIREQRMVVGREMQIINKYFCMHISMKKVNQETKKGHLRVECEDYFMKAIREVLRND